MKFIKILAFVLFFAPCVSFGASNDFMMAAQLLAAAKNADVQQVQSLVNAGANVNFVDSTGLSIVCTALMNNDVRAAQILQMYGADASKCDNQIKRYNNKTKTKGSGGLFSGLSSVQTLSLAAAGAAVVVGGLFLLTDVFDPGNDNDSGGSGGGNRPGGDSGGDTPSGSGSQGVVVAYSPAYLGVDGKMTTDSAVYQSNLLEWNPGAGGVREWDFNYFRPSVQTDNNFVVDGIKVPVQNYMLMMHGYSALANEYMGQKIFRSETSPYNPVKVGNNTGGGTPVTVSLVTKNGLNPTGSAKRADGISYADSASATANTYLVDKFLNYNAPDNNVENTGFDLTGAGTAMNPFASAYDSALGKIVAGWEAGERSYGDFYGFVPNGRLGIFRSGNGYEWVNVANPTDGSVVGTLTDTDADNSVGSGDTIVLNGKSYLLSLATGSAVVNPTITVNGTTYRVADNSSMLVGKCADTDCDDVSDIAIYQGTDGSYYVNTSGGNDVDAVYTMKDNNLYVQKEKQTADFKTFQALYNARLGADVIANVSVLDVARDNDYATVSDMPAILATSSAADTEDFQIQIDKVYDKNSDDATSQGAYANLMFNSYGSKSPIVVMPAGEYVFKNGIDGKSVLNATFENYAPAIYGNNLNQNFMTVVAVMNSVGTAAADTIAGYGNGTGNDFGKLYLSMYSQDVNNTPDDLTDDVIYSSRKCGIAGSGTGSVDPWCFASAGATAEMATASAAGAVASVQAAFDYMSNAQVYQLLALTADGYLLGTDASGAAFTTDSLAAYLKNMYKLPPEYYESGLSSEKYLQAFADVYGYGLINLERAMTPNKHMYFYDGNKIVSDSGNAYWRAATNTTFRPSSVLNVNGKTMRTAFYDVVSSADGKMTLPRIWENDFSLGGDTERGLYMGDVLGDLKTRYADDAPVQIGDFSFSMSVSERPYTDNMNGLDYMKLGYNTGNWNFGASYQHYLTDGASRFDGMSNPIFGLVSDAVVSDVEYRGGNWAFGARAFSGAVTDEGLLEHDPAISAQYMPGRLGYIHGGATHLSWNNDVFRFGASVGMAIESDTVLGAYSDGLIGLGGADTLYVDFESQYDFSDTFNIVARATFAQTKTDAFGDAVLGMSDLYSNALAIGANVGNFEFSVSQPLAIINGGLKYAYADYDVVDNGNGLYDINVLDTHVADLSLRPDAREMRFSGTYRHSFGEFTDGAFGFIYRVNPNHTDRFGNESIFMLKMTHRLGI